MKILFWLVSLKRLCNSSFKRIIYWTKRTKSIRWKCKQLRESWASTYYKSKTNTRRCCIYSTTNSSNVKTNANKYPSNSKRVSNRTSRLPKSWLKLIKRLLVQQTSWNRWKEISNLKLILSSNLKSLLIKARKRFKISGMTRLACSINRSKNSCKFKSTWKLKSFL